MKKKLVIACLLGIASPLALKAQTTTIDYQAWGGSAACNLFGSSISINGIAHKTDIGQPLWNVGGAAVELDCQYVGANPTGTEYELGYNFQAGHNYTLTITTTGNLNTAYPVLRPTITNSSSGANALCNGPQTINSSIASGQSISAAGFIDYTFSFGTISTSGSKLLLAALPDINAGTAFQAIFIRKIKIVDVAPPSPGTFTITSSQASRTCYNTNAINFSIAQTSNPNNVTVSSYKVYTPTGQWQYNGSAAPASIDIPFSNPSFTLTPTPCADNLNVTVWAVTSVGTVMVASKVISNTLPAVAPIITGPDTIISYGTATGSASYGISGGGYLSCTVPVWSVSSYASVVSGAPTNPLSATVTKVPSVYGVNTVLTANLQMCGLSLPITKTIGLRWKSSPVGFSRNSAANSTIETGVFPNPSKGKFTVKFPEYIESGSFEIHSVDGALIAQGKLSGSQYDFDITSFSSGVYFLLVKDGNTIIREKLIKE